MTTPTRRLAILAAAAATLAVSACSTPLSSSSTAEPPAVTTTTVVGASTPASTKGAELRAQLTALMVEHTYLVSRVVSDVIATGAVPSSSASPGAAAVGAPAPATPAPATPAPATPAPATPAPADAPSAGAPDVSRSSDSGSELDRNSRDLTDLISHSYPAEFGPQFYALWSQRIAEFEAYAQGRVGKSGPATSGATDALAANATKLATLFHANNKFIEVHTVSSPGTGLADELGPDNTAMTDLIDAQVGKDPTQVAKLVAAAEKMPHTAEFLAAATAKLDPDTYPGTVTGSASNLRASLTASFVEHVELAGNALEAVATGRDPGPAAAALDANGRQIANAFAAIYTDQAAATFLSSWRSHIGFFVDYAKAKAAGDPSGAATASAKLDEYTHAVGAFLSDVTKGRLPADTVAADFKMHVDSLLAVIDGAASHASDETGRLRTAAGHMPGTASAVAEAVAEQFPAKYLP
ncbi:MAG: hypothetical protein NVS3B12_12220 [Acidimicrobiales bacterium]